jgi:hypothetical protein
LADTLPQVTLGKVPSTTSLPDLTLNIFHSIYPSEIYH